MVNEQFYSHLAEKIRTIGFTFVGVFDEDMVEPAFAYSIGLTEKGWPEVLLIGNMRPQIIEIILTDLVKSWIAAGEVKMGDNDGLIVFPDMSEHPLRVVEVPSRLAVEKFCCQVQNFYEKEDVKVVQVLWPDVNGKFPGEEGYDALNMKQPVVGQ